MTPLMFNHFSENYTCQQPSASKLENNAKRCLQAMIFQIKICSRIKDIKQHPTISASQNEEVYEVRR